MDDDAPSPPPLEDFSRFTPQDLAAEIEAAADELDEMFDRAAFLADRLDRVLIALRRRGGPPWARFSFALSGRGARVVAGVMQSRFSAAPFVVFPLNPAAGVVSPADVRGRP